MRTSSIGPCYVKSYGDAFVLRLDEMTLQEKLAAMELLWEDLSGSPESVESPDWHRKVLEDRCQRVADGESGFTPWEQAKTSLAGTTEPSGGREPPGRNKGRVP